MTDNTYGGIAYLYDKLNGKTDYNERTEYMISLFKMYGHIPKILLDVCCGTGDFDCLFSKRGISVIAVDSSEDMLSVAQIKAQNEKQDILFLCQKVQELDLYGTVDGAVCCFDSINHITDANQLKTALKRISLFCEKDSIFIFDVNTAYKHKEILGNNTFVYDEDDLFFVWENNYSKRNDTIDIALNLFSKDDDAYIRDTQYITERAYSVESLKKYLNDAGFNTLAVYDDLSYNKPRIKSERLYFVAKKVK